MIMSAFVLLGFVFDASGLVLNDLKGNQSTAPQMIENNVPSSILKQSRDDDKQLFAQLKTNQSSTFTSWYMSSSHYWGCVDFVNYAQFLCHWNWKQTVSAQDFLDLDDVAECG